jgi:hypothetical protein
MQKVGGFNIVFELYSSFQLEQFWQAQTSAATPDFQASPTEGEQPAKKNGITEGTYIFNSFFLFESLNTFAISSSPLSVE